MNITELDSYNLKDAVKFRRQLNPKLWIGQKMRPEVRAKLLEIAEDFKDFLGLDNLSVKDVVVTGSNAGYTYTPYSDIDLHLVVDIPRADSDEVYRELFDAKKFQYNETHSIKIGGYDVELYVENANKPAVSSGVFSLVNDDWIHIPRPVRSHIDDDLVRSKYENLKHRIDSAVKSGAADQIASVAKKIKALRQSSLDELGELGPENLAYKMLRNQGEIKRLIDARNLARSQELSLKERKKPHSVFTYGFRHEESEPVVEPLADSVDDNNNGPTDEEILRDFVDFCAKELKLEEMPVIKLRKDPQWSVVHKTFGRYIDDKKLLEVAWGQRHIMDVLRTVAHELTHKHQHERDGSQMGPDAGETGSPWENEANARAGVLMRDYARLHPDYFEKGQAADLHLDEGVKSSALAAAVVAALAGAHVPEAQAQSVAQILGRTVGQTATGPLAVVRDAGMIARQAQSITRAGINAEVQQELQNFVRAQGQDAGAKNLSHLYQVQRELQRQEPGYQSQPYSGAYAQDVSQQGRPIPGYSQQGGAQQYPQQQYAADADTPYRGGNPLPGYTQRQYTDESASGYIPTKRQAKDPRFSMALTQDIKPGQLGKEANKLKLKTDKQGHPQIANANGLFEELMLRFEAYKRGDLLEAEELDEVSMAPSRLKQFASSPEAEGIQAGFEAELIFRDTTSDENDGSDMEPDYDADERCRSLSQIVEFFENGEYGYLSPRQRRALEEQLDEQYYEWYDEQMYASFRDEADDLVREIWLDEQPMSERVHAMLVDGMDLTDEQADRIQAIGEKAPRFTSSKEQEAYAEENPDYRIYLEAVEGAEEILEEEVEQSVSNQDKYYDSALDDFRDNFSIGDDSGFFDDVGLRWMSDVAEAYDLDWPYMMGGNGNDGDRDWDSIGDSLHDAIGMQVKVSSGYHSATRKPDLWIVEPDSSLEPDEREDYGLEIVSPPMPLLQALEKLDQVVNWANDPATGNAYTNESTGLHMGVSVPYKGGEVDYLKMLLFLGDEYVLEKFGRASNTYTRAAIKDIRSKAGSERNAQAVMTLLKHNLVELAERELVGGTGSGKYTSAHKQGKYIEFRSAGGDWLAKADEEIGVLENTMMRYAYAMYLGSRPDLERKEYAKKLYKLVASGDDDSTMALFSQFAAGELSKDQLKKQWAEKTLAKDDPSSVAKGNWRLIDKQTRKAVPGGFEFNNFTQDEARSRAKARISPGSSDKDFDLAYEIVPFESGKWEIYSFNPDTDEEKTLEIVDADRRGEAVDKVYDKYNSQGIPFKVRPYYGDQPATPEKELTPRAKLAKRITSAKPNWNVVYRPTGRVIDQILNVGWEEAQKLLPKVAQQHQFANTDDLELHNEKDTKAGAEQEPAVAQNFNQPQDATDVPRNWEFVDRITGRVIHNMTNASYNQANVVQANLEQQNPEADIYLRSVASLEENFADGKGPGRPGDSQRHGIPKGATMAQLEKAAKAPGRKGQLARWQLNMRRGKKK